VGSLKKLKKNIWIFNHYATDTFKDLGGRHFWFAENLIKLDHQATIFCASTIHNTDENIYTGGQKYKTDEVNGIPYVFVKTPSYVGNGKQRIKNMISFYKNLFPVAKEYAKIHGKPDVILASSVHPLTLIAGIKLAKKFGVRCVCEVRDLWPQTLVVHKAIKKNSLLAKLLYRGERWIYQKADELVFTMEGGRDYIIEQRWDKEHGGPIDLKKVHHINNGIDLAAFNYNKNYFILDDEDLNNPATFKVVYTGSIRKINHLKRAVEIAEIIQNKTIKSEQDIEKLLSLPVIGSISSMGKKEQKKIRKLKKKQLMKGAYMDGKA
jgi:glycosyltransferase involved in cell wall biosynthesis